MMKNRHFFYIAVALCCTAFFGACNKDNDFVDFGASIASYGNSGSKVYVDEVTVGETTHHFAYWHDGDKVMINGVEKTVSVTTNDDNQTIAAINGVAVEDNYYAIYPCDKVVSSPVPTTAFPSILMPQVQIYETVDGHQLINAPMAAYSSNTGRRTLNFTNLCSLIEVTLPEEKKVAYIQVTSNNHYLWGEATISGESTPSLTINDTYMANNYYTDNHTVILDCSTNGSNGSNNNGTAANGVQGVGPFYVVVPANDYENLKVEVYIYENGSDNTRRVVKRYSAEATVPAGSTTVNTNIASNMIYHIKMPNTLETVQPSYPGLGVGEFSVSATKKVRFSQGNLQYLASKGMWRFAPNQWDIIGNAEGNTTASPDRESQDAWIDLFGYGTSGKTYNGNSYSPCRYQLNAYGPSMNISNIPFDWGVNEISNGGNQPNKWRTLTASEWEYLVNSNYPTSTVRTGKCGMASVTYGGNTYKGLVLVPDTYNGLTFGYQEYKTIIQSQWETYSEKGCIFLPCAGKRSNLTVTEDYISVGTSNAEEDGYYWSSTWRNGYNASVFKSKIYQNHYGGQVSTIPETTDMGFSVRLVRDVD